MAAESNTFWSICSKLNPVVSCGEGKREGEHDEQTEAFTEKLY